MNYLDAATANPDGTYTIKGDPQGDWTLWDTGHGWIATRLCDTFDTDAGTAHHVRSRPNPDGVPDYMWASAEDAAIAVYGDPAEARRA